MSTETTDIRQAIVYRSHEYPHRWYDAFGEGVTKYITSFQSLPADDTTTDPTEYAITVVEVGGTSSAVINDTGGGALIVTCAGNEDDGYSMQLGNANTGRWADFSSDYPCYFGTKFQLNDADQTEILTGVCVTDTALLGGMTDGIFFRSVDESTTLQFVIEKDSVESVTAVATLADASDIECEWLYDGTTITAYINGTEKASIARTDASFPNDELLRLSLEVLSGEATANTCLMKYLRLIQIRY